MEDLTLFIENINQKVVLLPEELEVLLSEFKIRKVKKRQFIVQPEFVNKHRTYVLQGAFRAYVVDEKGSEHTIQFAIEDWWIADYNSYVYQTPATMFIVALEDSVILQIGYEAEQKLKSSAYNFEKLFRLMAEKSAAFYSRRIIAMLTQNAEERYNDFLEKFPKVAQRLPQYALASYLNMTTEFLSKIRNEKVKKKS
ncbi:Crp/Fnr family transcriptional regulator [Flavobacterium pectinovorum]|uniref:Crp/Fnr family transcriptional regulator n=1 Tax=Flavobacterium pectinovorum TaxID=29533 RepID=A0A502EZR3_9FLAO|nr:Crp/Fnr family transcriptional regulator [Flavobacterium pectinovorum]TPG42080.1 Crp/Fnr family transcriptional regulator [Flavobacterium pectinovorum]